MLKALAKLASLSVLGLIGTVALLFYRHETAAQTQIAALEKQTVELKDVIGRLEAERRVADFIVADEQPIDGQLQTTLFMVEYDRTGHAMPARSFVVRGERVHVDGLVVKFEPDDLQKGDGLRGHALLLLERIYGDAQAPAAASTIDSPDEVPDVYRNVDPKISDAERAIWKNFWRLADDASLREQTGVRVAHGAGVFVKPQPGRKYTITLQADGNITVYGEVLPEILDKLMKRQPAA